MVFSSDCDRNDCWLSIAATVTQTSIYTFPSDVFCLFCARKIYINTYEFAIRLHSILSYSPFHNVRNCVHCPEPYSSPSVFRYQFLFSSPPFQSFCIRMNRWHACHWIYGKMRVFRMRRQKICRGLMMKCCAHQDQEKIRTENKWNTSNWRFFVIFRPPIRRQQRAHRLDRRRPIVNYVWFRKGGKYYAVRSLLTAHCDSFLFSCGISAWVRLPFANETIQMSFAENFHSTNTHTQSVTQRTSVERVRK